MTNLFYKPNKGTLMKHLTALTLALMFATTSMFAQATKQQLTEYVNAQDFDNAGKIVEEVANASKDDAATLLMCGEVYEELDNYHKATEMYILADKADGGEFETYLKIGTAASKDSNYAEAGKWFNKAINSLGRKEKKLKYRAELAYADALILADSMDKAEKMIVAIRSKDDENPDVYLKLGNLYFAQNIYQLAETNYKQVLKMDDKNIQARINLAVSYYWLGNGAADKDLMNDYYNRCLDEWTIVSDQDPMNAKAWEMQGKILFASQKYKRSAEAYANYIKLRPSDIDARWKLGKSYYEAADCDGARENLEMVVNNDPEKKDEANTLIARCYYENKNYPKAIETFLKISDIEMKDLRRVGMAYLNTGDSLKAYDTWMKAYDEDPSDLTNIKYLRQTAFLMGSMKPKMRVEAVDVAKKWLANPNAPEENKATMNYVAGMHLIFLDSAEVDTTDRALTREGISYLEKSIELNPNYVYSYMYLGDGYAKIDSNDKAVEIFYKGVEICKSDSAKYYKTMTGIYSKIASVFYGAKDWSGLKEHATNWSTDQPDSEYAWLYLGFANQYAATPNKSEAIKAFKKCLAINPKNKYANKGIQAMSATE
jgi:tetratricopeptide (TPR) repeat protein